MIVALLILYSDGRGVFFFLPDGAWIGGDSFVFGGGMMIVERGLVPRVIILARFVLFRLVSVTAPFVWLR